jgi:viroplasmin and RNaseH domain-containing protein
MTEHKALNWSRMLNLEYVDNSRGRRHHNKSFNNSLEKSKSHLGLPTCESENYTESPTFKRKPEGRKHEFKLVKENKPIIVDLSSYSSTKMSNQSTTQSSNMSRVFSDDTSDSFKKLLQLKMNFKRENRDKVN